MPDDSTALTAKPIPGSLTIAGQSGPMNIVPHNMAEAIEFARVMSKAGVFLRPHFRDNPGACLAVALQAWRWSADPLAVASKAFVVNDQVAYESQLIHAIVNSSAILAKRLRSDYSGEGDKRRCKITGWLRGEDEPFEYESPEIGKIPVKNSPLWKSDPDQQLFYMASRAWARRHVPEILLGIYTTDEIDGQIIDVTADRIEAHAAALQHEAKRFEWVVYDHAGENYEFKTPENAYEACRKILIASAGISPEALATAWENNEHIRHVLREAEYGHEALGLDRLYHELSPVSDQPEQKGEVTTGESPGKDAQADKATGDTSAPGEPAQRPASDDSTQPLADAGPTPSEPVPPAQNDRSAAAEAPPQSGERHDPFWDRDSLRIDPMPVKGGGSLNKLDWRTWPALLTPRIRQAWSIPLLNALAVDNHENLDRYASAVGARDRDEIDGLFQDARDRLSDAR